MHIYIYIVNVYLYEMTLMFREAVSDMFLMYFLMPCSIVYMKNCFVYCCASLY